MLKMARRWAVRLRDATAHKRAVVLSPHAALYIHKVEIVCESRDESDRALIVRGRAQLRGPYSLRLYRIILLMNSLES